MVGSKNWFFVPMIASLLFALPFVGRAQDESAASTDKTTQADQKKGEELNDSVPLPPMGIYVRETIQQKLEPVPYPYVREADVLWSKIIWRKIDLRQKMNLPLYYPTETMRDRKSVVQTIYDAVQDNEIQAYDADVAAGDELVHRLTPSAVKTLMGADDMVMQQVSMVTGLDSTWTVKRDVKWENVQQLLLKEEWFFDSKRSVLEVRIIGICPVMKEVREIGDQTIVSMVPKFWIYYPEARKVLAKAALFNPKNDAQVCSYDDLFFKRRFGSYIVRESNEYNNRSIANYKNGGVAAMQESDRIYNEIFNREQDLWEY